MIHEKDMFQCCVVKRKNKRGASEFSGVDKINFVSSIKAICSVVMLLVLRGCKCPGSWPCALSLRFLHQLSCSTGGNSGSCTEFVRNSSLSKINPFAILMHWINFGWGGPGSNPGGSFFVFIHFRFVLDQPYTKVFQAHSRTANLTVTT